MAAAAAAALTAAAAAAAEKEEAAAARAEEAAARVAAAEKEAAADTARAERAARARAAAAAKAVETCDICLDDFETGELVWETCCGKRFHCECFYDRPWLVRPNSGPRYCHPSGTDCDIVTEGRWVASCSALAYGRVYPPSSLVTEAVLRVL